MVKNLKVWKKGFAVAALTLATLSANGCGKEEQEAKEIVTIQQEKDYDNIYFTSYDDNNLEFLWRKISQEEYQNIDSSIIAETSEEDDTTLYVASYLSLGYMAASKNESKIEAMENNPRYKDNAMFLAGFDMGKRDKYIKKALAEKRQYVSIKKTAVPTSNTEDTVYFPAEELTVISYAGDNALVTNYEEERIAIGDYIDLLGKDMSSYIGQQFIATPLKQFANEHTDTLFDAEYMAVGSYDLIPEISGDTFIKENALTQTMAR